MKKIISLGLFLGILVGLSTVALTVVNSITAPVIARAQDELFYHQLDVAFPDATRFVHMETDTPHTIEIVRALAGDTLLGYVYVQEIVGFADVVRYMLVMDNDGYIRDFLTLLNSETIGFADPVRLYSWAEGQFINAPGDTSIDILAGATVTTTPIIRAIRYAYDDFESRR
ncbi:MAG: FMN-binding protein [Defluviitaleaceae bacterium]|nr:FMN-binding protein [Defluviitaleaceae bacterium]